MTLPTNRELREMLECASPYPWQKAWRFIIPSDRERDRLLADLGGGDGVTSPRKEDTDLMLIAPQLAEEVIRLRDEIDDMADFYRRMRDRADERLARTEQGSTDDFILGRFFTLYTRIIDRLERIKEGGDE